MTELKACWSDASNTPGTIRTRWNHRIVGKGVHYDIPQDISKCDARHFVRGIEKGEYVTRDGKLYAPDHNQVVRETWISVNGGEWRLRDDEE
jgi:hypothetical protein